MKAEDVRRDKDAESLLKWANEQNPGPWAAHSETVARAAAEIAVHCGLDVEKAYAMGLLHDIGRYEGVRDLHHVVAGYELMQNKGFHDCAHICLTHSFPIKDIGAYSGKNFDCTQAELDFLKKSLADAEYDEYDSLIQLCDSICLPQGVCLMDVRLLNVVRRYGFNDFTLRKWDALFALKAYFDKRCACNIYDLFHDEIREISFS